MSHGAVLPSFGRFQSLQVVRHEGATTFHSALDPESGQQVALITAPAGPDPAEESRLAFRLPRMRHPNVVSVLDAGLQGEVAFVAAECLRTEALSAFLARPGRMPFFQGLPLVLQLLSAIEHAQARRLVHAGIDVEHVQATPGGQVKLPAAGWSLSADRQPNLEAAARVARVVLSRSCPPALRPALDEVLERAESPDRAARYPSAEAFILALLAAAGYPVGGRSAAAERRVPAEPQRDVAGTRVTPAVPVEAAPRVEPARPVEPVLRVEPARPVEPALWVDPAGPAEPAPRVESIVAVEHAMPVEPALRVEPVVPLEHAEPVQAAVPVEHAKPVQAAVPVEPAPRVEPVLRVEPMLRADPEPESEPVRTVEPVLLADPVRPAKAATRAVRHAPRKPLRRHRTGRHLLAACLLAALLVPRWVGEHGGEGPVTPAETVALGAAPTGAALLALAHAVAAHLAPEPVAPEPVAPAPVATPAAAPATVALASMTAPPAHTPAVQPATAETSAVQRSPVEAAAVEHSPVSTPAVERPPVPAPAVERPPVPAPAVERPPAEPAPVVQPPSHAARPSADRSPPVAAAARAPAAKPVARRAARPKAAHVASSRPVHSSRPAVAHARAARPQRARVVTAASGCPYDVPIFRELCEARNCERPELRNDPACRRMRAEQRAALARLRGTPD